MRNIAKRLIKLLGLAAITCTILGFISCGAPKRPTPKPKATKIQAERSEYEIFVGEFDYSAVTLIVEYSNQSTRKIPLEESMLSAKDVEKQNEVGEHTLTVKYEKLSCTFLLKVLETTFVEIQFTDVETVYNGEAQSVVLTNLPSSASVVYTNNDQTDVGVYEVVAEITFSGGAKETMTATLTITKAPLKVVAEVAKSYVNFTPEYSYSLVGLLGKDDETALSTIPSLVAGEAVSAAGVYKDYVKYQGAVAKNYEISYLSADLVILETPQITTENGKQYLTLGEYPQTVVLDQATVSTLDEKIADGTLIADRKGYYTLDGKSYVKMTANNYVNGESYGKFTDGTDMQRGKTYYFAVEPIRWQVLSQTSGITLISEKLLDTQPFWDIENTVTINGVTYKPNDYSQSEIREWLNGEFRNIAFGAHERAIMNKVTVSNTAADSLYPDYPCETTKDYVYLPSYKDITSADYGFTTNMERMSLTTDYTRATGTYMRPALPTDPAQLGYGQYYLRSAGFSGIREVSVVDCFGNPTKEAQSGSAIVCIRPMINITLPA